jgi:uncharacterized membrane protein
LQWLHRVMERLVDAFGSITFILLFNIITPTWVILGLTWPHFFDPFPSNFYTLTVSWWAINETSFILWNERRNKQREEQRRLKEYETTQAILHISESVQHMLEYLVAQSGGEKSSERD